MDASGQPPEPPGRRAGKRSAGRHRARHRPAGRRGGARAVRVAGLPGTLSVSRPPSIWRCGRRFGRGRRRTSPGSCGARACSVRRCACCRWGWPRPRPSGTGDGGGAPGWSWRPSPAPYVLDVGLKTVVRPGAAPGVLRLSRPLLLQLSQRARAGRHLLLRRHRRAAVPPPAEPGSREILVWVAAIVLILLIGVSRIYLGVHYPTDVIGGFAVGTVWVASVALGDRLAERRRLRV